MRLAIILTLIGVSIVVALIIFFSLKKTSTPSSSCPTGQDKDPNGNCCSKKCDFKTCGNQICSGDTCDCSPGDTCVNGSCCTPKPCDGKCTSTDGCSNTPCKICGEGTACSPSGECVCVPVCPPGGCGMPDGCGGTCSCPSGGKCVDGKCCTPVCTGCGGSSDGCGDVCPVCSFCSGGVCLDLCKGSSLNNSTFGNDIGIYKSCNQGTYSITNNPDGTLGLSTSTNIAFTLMNVGDKFALITPLNGNAYYVSVSPGGDIILSLYTQGMVIPQTWNNTPCGVVYDNTDTPNKDKIWRFDNGKISLVFPFNSAGTDPKCVFTFEKL